MTVRAKEKQERMKVLVKLEEELLEARGKLNALDATNAEIRTVEQRNELLDLPRSLVLLEQKIQLLADEVGYTELINVRRGPDAQVKSVLAVQVALGFLYEAKFDVIQQVANAAIRTGATQQPRNDLRHASKYNERYRPAHRLQEPSLDEVVAMDLLDPFWDEVALNHQDEPWATCQSTKDGIVALRNKVACEEELRRLGREVRQLVRRGLDFEARVEACKPSDANGELRIAEWSSIYSGLAKRTCRLWKHWDRGLLEVLQATHNHVGVSVESDNMLIVKWERMVSRTQRTWAEILGVLILEGDFPDEVDDWAEEEFDDHPMDAYWMAG
ncbi:uncharacterized protein MELLADRAFT_69702 [Melampsora larici-populina 98AG31]|uniref:Uncharacterized protein n=1 Tax=Melampsora larici-populina (strain 98AG31 / pathotype 3-4-7) TaxID=747676 RepID=F4SBT9_MELLP|nr:uncharacterized protein MELLADRAFT_69702 [Melampsora larici-populina 98AG31]EGF97887.1 hypothetical protein MELLADRAFT_69702 [Melampsora larici-populina 98AG31]